MGEIRFVLLILRRTEVDSNSVRKDILCVISSQGMSKSGSISTGHRCNDNISPLVETFKDKDGIKLPFLEFEYVMISSDDSIDIILILDGCCLKLNAGVRFERFKRVRELERFDDEFLDEELL